MDRIPLDMFEKAVQYLHEVKGMESVSTYGMSMGSLFAALVAKYIDRIDNVIMVSPSHVPLKAPLIKEHDRAFHDDMEREGNSFCKLILRHRRLANTYDERAGRKVTGMWISYRDAYQNKEAERQADIHIEELNARILLIAESDEAWPSDYSVNYMKQRLDESGYPKDYEAVIYPNASHLLGMMPGKAKNKWLYRMIPLIGMMYKSINLHREDCMKALEDSEKKIIEWIRMV